MSFWVRRPSLAPQTPTSEPSFVRVGDSWIWSRTLGDYPSSESWTLAYQLNGASAFTWSAGYISVVGSTYTVNIPASATQSLEPGTYVWVLTATGSGTYAGRRDTVDYGRFDVQPNVAVAAPGDLQTHAEKMLAAVKATLEGRVTSDVLSYTIGGRQVVKMAADELLRWRRHYEWEVYREKNPGRGGAPIAVGFSVPGGSGGPYQSGIVERWPWVVGSGPN